VVAGGGGHGGANGGDVCWRDGGQPDPEMEGGELHSTTPLPPCRLRLAGLAWLHLHFSLLCIFYFIGHCYGGTELGLFTFASPLELKTMNTPTILNNVDFTMNLDRAEKSRGSSSLLPSVFFALIKSKPIECAFLDYRVLRLGNMLRI
jgi:hypothetical protein